MKKLALILAGAGLLFFGGCSVEPKTDSTGGFRTQESAKYDTPSDWPWKNSHIKRFSVCDPYTGVYVRIVTQNDIDKERAYDFGEPVINPNP